MTRQIKGKPIELTIRPTLVMAGEESVTAPLKKAADVYATWHTLRGSLADSIAECIQACANLAYYYGIDLGEAMLRCEARVIDE